MCRRRKVASGEAKLRFPRSTSVVTHSPIASSIPESFDIAMNQSQVRALIEAGLPGAQVDVRSDDDTHFEAVIVARQFEGKRTLQRHQLIYATLGALMGREIHALSMQVMTPEEAEKGSGLGARDAGQR
jgi:acid stress-induced BolA-like protein IbaG/YrbA